ncbi:hypothetical protein [Bradyrhizobium sp. AZCC 2230]|uniref:hypothetical protein n=1 Tax=Bradyrhizobium sp. AZCC 2230 TaxID=3117021 RepID=UPI002FEF2DA4
MSDLISDYLDTLTRELSFDPALARRMRKEAEDHLHEAVASDPMGATIEAERRAIGRFGTERDIAAQYAVPSLVKQARNVGAAVPLIAVGVLVAMKSRIAWYGASQQIVSGDPHLDNIRAIISSIDRWSFWSALLIAVCAWAYVSVARAPDAANTTWRNRLQKSLFLCAAAAAAVVVTVTSDTILTALRPFPAGWSASIIFPFLTIGLEAALAAVLVVRIRVTMHRLASSARLFNVQNSLASEAP